MVTEPLPASRAHGWVYWTLLGWYWEPAKWVGRVLLWVFFLPLGIWRSVRHQQKTRERRQRRGYARP